ncbi:hypothetical protein Ct9H90mP29_11440 [bacterium]|nr:MAG: hypothetical protein Ct9H90mP29_11440 [bacterium]
MFEALNKIDTAVLIWVHDHHNNIFDLFMPFVTDADNWILPILVLIFYLGIKGGKKRQDHFSIIDYCTRFS